MTIHIKAEGKETYIVKPTQILFTKLGIQADGSITPINWATSTGSADGVVVYYGENAFIRSIDPETIAKIRKALEGADSIEWK